MKASLPIISLLAVVAFATAFLAKDGVVSAPLACLTCLVCASVGMAVAAKAIAYLGVPAFRSIPIVLCGVWLQAPAFYLLIVPAGNLNNWLIFREELFLEAACHCCAGYLFFLFGFILTNLKGRIVNTYRLRGAASKLDETGRYLFAGIALLAVSLFAIIYRPSVTLEDVSYNEMYRYENIAGTGRFFGLLFVALLISAYAIGSRRIVNWMCFIPGFLALLYCCYIALVETGRRQVIFFGMMAIVGCWFSIRRKMRWSVVVGAGILVSAIFVAVTFYRFEQDTSIAADQRILALRDIVVRPIEDAAFVGGSMARTLAVFDNKTSLMWGRTVVPGLVYLVPLPLAWMEAEEELSFTRAIMYETSPGGFEKGIGVGSSFVTEGYVNFGYAYPLWALAFGALLGAWTNMCVKLNNRPALLIVVLGVWAALLFHVRSPLEGVFLFIRPLYLLVIVFIPLLFLESRRN